MEEAGDVRQRAVIRVIKEEASVRLTEEAGDARQRAVIRRMQEEATVRPRGEA